MRYALPLLAALALAACDPAASDAAAPDDDTAEAAGADASADPASAEGSVLAADGEGLRLVDAESGSTSLLAFGAPRDQTLAAIDAAGGTRRDSGANDECPPGPLEFVNYDQGITVMFQDGAFAGWSADQPGLTTLNGVGVGSTAAEVAEAGGALTETTLGQEFDLGGVHGIMNEDASAVAVLWSGVNCFAR